MIVSFVCMMHSSCCANHPSAKCLAQIETKLISLIDTYFCNTFLFIRDLIIKPKNYDPVVYWSCEGEFVCAAIHLAY